MQKRKRLIIVALALESTLGSSAGKIETLGSIFSHETAGLLASSATIQKDFSALILG